MNNNGETSDPLRYCTMNIIAWKTGGKKIIENATRVVLCYTSIRVIVTREHVIILVRSYIHLPFSPIVFSVINS